MKRREDQHPDQHPWKTKGGRQKLKSKLPRLCCCQAPQPTSHLLPSLRVVHHGFAVLAPWLGWAPSPHCFVRVSLSPFGSPCHLEVLSPPLAHTADLHTDAPVLTSCLALGSSNCPLWGPLLLQSQ